MTNFQVNGDSPIYLAHFENCQFGPPPSQAPTAYERGSNSLAILAMLIITPVALIALYPFGLGPCLVGATILGVLNLGFWWERGRLSARSETAMVRR